MRSSARSGVYRDIWRHHCSPGLARVRWSEHLGPTKMSRMPVLLSPYDAMPGADQKWEGGAVLQTDWTWEEQWCAWLSFQMSHLKLSVVYSDANNVCHHMFETENKALKLKSSIVQIGLKDKIKLLKGKVVISVFMANMIVTMCYF